MNGRVPGPAGPCLARAGALAAVLLLAPPGRAAEVVAGAAAAPETLQVAVAGWEAGALGRRATGTLAWAVAGDGAVRLDLLADEPGTGAGEPAAAAAAVMGRQGRGWTLVAGPGDAGVFGAWDREWRPAPAGLATLVRAVAAGRAARLVLAADAGEGLEPDLPAPGRGFRWALARRGWGGGGPGERLAVTATADGSTVRVRSSRRPGALVVARRGAGPALGDPAAVFLPWYPLGEVLAAVPGGAPIPGTSGTGPR